MKLLRMKAAADFLQCSTQSVKNWTEAGLLKTTRRTPGGHKFFSKEELEAFIRRMESGDFQRRLNRRPK